MTERPAHLRISLIALVALGGAIGVAAREAIGIVAPSGEGFDVTIFAINVTGALLLGVLLEDLARRGDDAGVRRATRLFLGTGILGGYTTYSVFATGTAMMLLDGDIATAALYAVGTVLVGALASWLGVAGSAALHGRPGGRRGPGADGATGGVR
ncbi:fluoride efflux transporter FluC [Marisediminicola senii]|uniref:fluoride efflux transporter FluC n=1 Tax=Marisediminicola senii TaxID=2711233 RepID=UPI001F4900BA|nr:CrcB family protein [Marisediminicola senii]